MNSLAIASIMFVCAFCGSLLGMLIQQVLPRHHLSPESRDAIKQGTGLIATMSALILGLLVASAKSSYDAQKNQIALMSSKVLFLDRTLANYGAQATDARDALRKAVIHVTDQTWPKIRSQTPQLDPMLSKHDELYAMIEGLTPENEPQRLLKARALDLGSEIAQMRWDLYGHTGSSVSMAFVVMVIFWLTLIFVGFGVLAPRNGTVLVTLLLCALSVAGALFLILELDHPFDGLIRISDSPMRAAIERLGQ